MSNQHQEKYEQEANFLPEDPLLFYDHVSETTQQEAEHLLLPHLYTLNNLYLKSGNAAYLFEADHLAGYFSMYLPPEIQKNFRQVTQRIARGEEVSGLLLPSTLRKEASKGLDSDVLLMSVWLLVEECGNTIQEAAARTYQRFESYCRANSWGYNAKTLAADFSKRREEIGLLIQQTRQAIDANPGYRPLENANAFEAQFSPLNECSEHHTHTIALNRHSGS
ncbi:hypothetical protein [Ferrimonas pelagia]|uniref:Uncharacterized protein n=1 Tax=Ferrimonas pelagia TaxID=1177826 RepID=A0ABP9ENQ8_9GAMM